MSWRDEKRSSSRISGTAKSFCGERCAPRSSTRIFSPVGPSSLARMPPVQPMPMMTMSTGGSLVAMMHPPSRHIGDADGIGGEAPSVVVGLDVFGIVGGDAREADHLPADLVAVAAIDRVREHPLHHVVVEHREEGAAG